MRIMASNARLHRKGSIVPSRFVFERIGQLTFDELSSLRHRGAFTTVSQTFSSCCQLVRYFPKQAGEDRGQLEQWFEVRPS